MCSVCRLYMTFDLFGFQFVGGYTSILSAFIVFFVPFTPVQTVVSVSIMMRILLASVVVKILSCCRRCWTASLLILNACGIESLDVIYRVRERKGNEREWTERDRERAGKNQPPSILYTYEISTEKYLLDSFVFPFHVSWLSKSWRFFCPLRAGFFSS